MALAVLATGLSVGNKIHHADVRIALLSEILGQQDRLDQAQRRLRQDVGRLTRDAEQGVKVPSARWRTCTNDIRRKRLYFPICDRR
jgi:hypothetical protein